MIAWLLSTALVGDYWIDDSADSLFEKLRKVFLTMLQAPLTGLPIGFQHVPRSSHASVDPDGI